MSDEKHEYKKTIHFTGKVEDWVGWEEKFLAKAMSKGYYELLVGEVEIPKSSNSQPSDAEKKQTHLNSVGYLDMIMSVDHTDRKGRVAFNLIRSSKTTDYIHGNIKEAFTKLRAKYAPKTGVVIAQLEQEFFDSRMRKETDPNDFIADMEDIRARMAEMGSTIGDDQFLRRIVNNLTEEYEFVVQSVEERIGDKKAPLTIEELRIKLTLAYQRKKGRSRGGTDDESEDDSAVMEEHLLLATDGQFKGRCHNCGKYGHKRSDCKEGGIGNPGTGNLDPNNKNPNGGQGNGGEPKNNPDVNNPNQRMGQTQGNWNQWNTGGFRGNWNPMFQGGPPRMGFHGACHYCGAVGHRIRECRKRYQDMMRQQNGMMPNGPNVPTNVYSPINSPGQGGLEEPGEHGNFAQDLEGSQKEGVGDELLFSSMDFPWKVPDSDKGKATHLELEEDSESEEEFEVGVCANCGGKGQAYTLCTSCEDTGMIYEPETGTPEPTWLRQVIEGVALDKGLEGDESKDWSDKVESSLRSIGIKEPREILNFWPEIQDDLYTENDEYQLTQDTLKRLGIKAYKELIIGVDFPKEGDEYALMGLGKMVPYKMNRNTWLGDSGASTHMGNCDKGMFQTKNIKSVVRVGNGMTLTATKVGKKRLMVIQANGDTMNCVLEDFKFVPELWVNLFSITKALKNKWNLSNEGEMIVVHRGNQRIMFDRFIPTEKGHVVGVEMVPREIERGQSTYDIGCHLNINYVHVLLGHCNQTTVRRTAEYYGWKLVGKWEPCEACAIGKAKQKRLSKETTSQSKEANERWFVDISSVKKESSSGKKFWVMIVDDFTGMSWSRFVQKKNEVGKEVLQLICEMEGLTGKKVRAIRLDNAGENFDLQKKLNRARLGIRFEFTSPNTPQYNGKVERKFTTLYAKARAMIAAAGLPEEIKFKLWCEAVRHATNIENTLVRDRLEVSAHKRYFGTDSKVVANLSQFGEMAVIADQRNKNTRNKLQNRGKTCMYLGFAHNHTSGVSRFWDVTSKRVIVSRNITWLSKTMGEWMGLKGPRYPIGVSGMVGKVKDIRQIVKRVEESGSSESESTSTELQHDEDSERSEGIEGVEQESEPELTESDEAGESDRETVARRGGRKEAPLIVERVEARGHGMTTRGQAKKKRGNSPVGRAQISKVNPRLSREMDRLASITMNPEALKFGERQKNVRDQRMTPATQEAEIRTREPIGDGTEIRTREQIGEGIAKSQSEREVVTREGDDDDTGSQVRGETWWDDDEDDEEVIAMPTMELESKAKFWRDEDGIQTLNVEDAFHTVEELKRMDPSEIPPEMYRDIFETPRTFKAAWNHQDDFQRTKWREAILKELKKMEEHKVWVKMSKSEMGRGRRCVKCKWVLDIKRNGIFRARLVACGYSQIAGIDFTESYSPVVHDSTFRMLLTMKMVLGWDITLVDVETAFLHGILEEDIYMECPPGMEATKEDCLLLVKTIYGLVQSARAFYKKLRDVLLKLNFEESKVDPCLFCRSTRNGKLFLAIYVDDVLMCGDTEAIAEGIEDIKKSFKLKVEPEVQDYLSCELKFNQQQTKCWIGQPHLVKHLEKDFGDEVRSLQKYATGGTPGFRFVKPKDGEAKLSPEDQKDYRSGVGMLLYLVKLTRPDLANCVRELSKGMSEANYGALKELRRIIKYVIDTKDWGLKMATKKETDDDGNAQWKMNAYTDSDWGGDKDTRRSVSGLVVFFMGCPVMWRSKAQNCVSLSSAEAEWYALAEVAKEVRFLYQLMESIGVEVELPIVIRVDNVATIFMAENSSTTARARHIDIRTCFIKEMVAEGFIRIEFVKSEDNTADILTKNTTGETMESHQEDLVIAKEEMEDEGSSDENREGVGEIFSPEDVEAGLAMTECDHKSRVMESADPDTKYEIGWKDDNDGRIRGERSGSVMSEDTIRTNQWCQRGRIQDPGVNEDWRRPRFYNSGETTAVDQGWVVVEGKRSGNRRRRRVSK